MFFAETGKTNPMFLISTYTNGTAAEFILYSTNAIIAFTHWTFKDIFPFPNTNVNSFTVTPIIVEVFIPFLLFLLLLLFLFIPTYYF